MSLKKLYLFTLTLLLLLFCIFIYMYFYSEKLVYLLIVSNVLLFFCIFYCFNNLKYQIVTLFFYIGIYIFLLSMPTIDYIRLGGFIWYDYSVYNFSIKVIIISTIAIFLGSAISGYYFNIKKYNYKKVANNLESIRLISLITFFLTYPFYLILNIEKVLFKINVGDYYVYFANFQSELPKIFEYISLFTVYAMLIYLSTKPKKLYASILLLLYIFSNFILLLTGTRNPFILSVLFSFIYFFIRNQLDKGKWIGKKEKFLISFMSIPIIVIMGAINYIRDGVSLGKLSFLDLILDFFYKQGTSFNVIANGYRYMNILPNRAFRSYTFGSIIDYVHHSKLGNFLFNSQSISDVTRLDKALNGNSLAHNLSYIVFPKEYLNGHGVGDSYIIDNYIDYGFLGVIILGLFIGILLVVIVHNVYKGNIFLSTISLVILTAIFFMPRGSFSENFTFLFTIPFWMIYFFIIILSKLIKTKNLTRR